VSEIEGAIVVSCHDCYNFAVIIDFHTHIVPPRVKQDRQAYCRADRGFAAIFSDLKAKLATADELITAMDKDGVDISIVLNFGWQQHAFCVETNDYILESVSRFPSRLVGFCSVPFCGDDISLKEVERCAIAGMKGVGEIRPDSHFKGNRILEVSPLVNLMVKRGLILLVHSSEPVGHQYPGKGTATPDIIQSIIGAHPDLKIVCAHWGGGLPFYALMPEVKDSLKNVYFDTAASPFLYQPEVYMKAGQIVGFDKILFGSDYPLLPPRRYFKEMDSITMPRNIQEKILGGNAGRVLGISVRRG
jgi:predicted TIM-barrel fold metal-dependent hydrolase